MADTTIVNTSSRGANADDATDSVVGWVIAAIVPVAIIVGAVILLRNNNVAPTTVPSINVDVTLPAGSGTGSGTGTGTGTGGTAQ